MDEEKHYTLKFLEDATLDMHETIEGKEKFDEKYPLEKREKLDLKRFAEATKHFLRRELTNISEEIDINDPKYRNMEVLIIPKLEKLEKATEVGSKEIVLEKDIMKNVSSVPMKDLKDVDFQLIFISKENKEYFLYRKDQRYFLLKMDDLEKSINEILEKSKLAS